jgi:hypothetical protein
MGSERHGGRSCKVRAQRSPTLQSFSERIPSLKGYAPTLNEIRETFSDQTTRFHPQHPFQRHGLNTDFRRFTFLKVLLVTCYVPRTDNL